MTNITLTDIQQKAIEICFNNFKQRQETVIAGYAGTGKSTLVRFLIDRLIQENYISEPEVVYTTFTGKAAQVLTNKGCSALTLHKLMYEVHVDRSGEITFTLKDELPAKLIIVDECSMVPLNMIQELRSFGIALIFLGDPGQLPPIQKDTKNGLLDNPDIFLKEVHRQALDSPIIQLSMKIRNQENIDNFKEQDAKVITRQELSPGELKNADMILVGTNKLRQRVNKAMRVFLKKQGDIDENEKIICTQNYWESLIEMSLTNGTVGLLKDIKETTSTYFKGKLKVPVYYGLFTSESGLQKRIKIDQQFLTEETSSLTFKQELYIKPRILQPLKFTYAYAITGHKAQGSEWDNVIVFEESFPFDRDEHTRWLYTCVTRARKTVTIVRGGF